MAKYDFIIVGAGIFGASCARLLTDKGYKCLIIEKRDHVGGLCYDQEIKSINVTMYGPHVLHTDNERIWDFLNKYGEINRYFHIENILKNDKIYRVPVDMLTINQLFGKTTAQGAYKCIINEIKNYNINSPENLEDECIIKFGTTIYGYLLKNLYEKKYGKKCSELAINMPFMIPTSIKHEPLFYVEKFQGYPKEGYTKLIENMIGNDIDIMLNTDFIKNIDKYTKLGQVVIYTGALDELCHYCYGALPWQSAKFSHTDETMRGNYIYGVSVTNIEDIKQDIFRITEHKWFTPERIDNKEYEESNIVTYEYAKKWEPGDETLYAIIDSDAAEKVKKYMDFVNENYPNVVLCGKNASFDNFTICESIQGAMAICDSIDKKSEN